MDTKIFDTRVWNIAAPIIGLVAATTPACGKSSDDTHDSPDTYDGYHLDGDYADSYDDPYDASFDGGYEESYADTPDCSSDEECGDGYVCEAAQCIPQPPLDCGDRLALADGMLLFDGTGAITSLAFVDVGAPAGAGLLVGGEHGLVRVDSQLGVRELSSEPTSGVAAGDLDGDGDDDVVFIVGSDAAQLRVLLASGEGAFAEGPGVVGGGRLPTLGDFDGDGRLDLVLVGASTLVQRTGIGDGRFAEPDAIAGTELAATHGFAVVQPSDGLHADLLLVAENELRIAFGAQGLSPRSFWSSGTDTQSWRAPVSGDHDGDGTPEVSAYLPELGAVYTWASVTGSEDPRARAADVHDELATGDLDGDGFDELVAASSAGALAVRYGQAGSSEGEVLGCLATTNLPGVTAVLAVGDLDGDARDDVVSAADGRVWWTRSQ